MSAMSAPVEWEHPSEIDEREQSTTIVGSIALTHAEAMLLLAQAGEDHPAWATIASKVEDVCNADGTNDPLDEIATLLRENRESGVLDDPDALRGIAEQVRLTGRDPGADETCDPGAANDMPDPLVDRLRTIIDEISEAVPFRLGLARPVAELLEIADILDRFAREDVGQTIADGTWIDGRPA